MSNPGSNHDGSRCDSSNNNNPNINFNSNTPSIPHNNKNIRNKNTSAANSKNTTNANSNTAPSTKSNYYSQATLQNSRQQGLSHQQALYGPMITSNSTFTKLAHPPTTPATPAQSRYYPPFVLENTPPFPEFPPELSSYPTDQYTAKQCALLASFRTEAFFNPTQPIPAHVIMPHIASSSAIKKINTSYHRILGKFCNPMSYRTNGGKPPKVTSFLRDYKLMSTDLMKFYICFSHPKTRKEPSLLDSFTTNYTALFDHSHSPNTSLAITTSTIPVIPEAIGEAENVDCLSDLFSNPTQETSDQTLVSPLTPINLKVREIQHCIQNINSTLVALRENASPYPFIIPYWEFLSVDAVIQLHVAKVFTISQYIDHLVHQHSHMAAMYYDQVVPWSANNIKQKLLANKITTSETLLLSMKERLTALNKLQSGANTAQNLSSPNSMNDLSPLTCESSPFTPLSAFSSNSNLVPHDIKDESPSIDISSPFSNLASPILSTPSVLRDETATPSVLKDEIITPFSHTTNLSVVMEATPSSDQNADTHVAPKKSTMMALGTTTDSTPFVYDKMHFCGFTTYPLNILFGNTATATDASSSDATGVTYDESAELAEYIRRYSPYTHNYTISSKNMLKYCNEKDNSAVKHYLDELGICYDPVTEVIIFKDPSITMTADGKEIPTFLQKETFVVYTPPYWFIVFWRKFEQYLYDILMCYKYLAKNGRIRHGIVHPEITNALKTNKIKSSRIEEMLLFFYRSSFLAYIAGCHTPPHYGGADIALDFGEEVCGESIELQYELLSLLHRNKKLYEIHHFYTRFTNQVLYPKTATIFANQVNLQKALPLYFAERTDLVENIGGEPDKSPSHVSTKLIDNPRLLDEHYSLERRSHKKGIEGPDVQKYYQIDTKQVVYVSNDYLLCDMFIYLYNIISLRCLDIPRNAPNEPTLENGKISITYESVDSLLTDLKFVHDKLKDYAISKRNDPAACPTHVSRLFNSSFATNFNGLIPDQLADFLPSDQEQSKQIKKTNNTEYFGKYDLLSFDKYFLQMNAAQSVTIDQKTSDETLILLSQSNSEPLTIPANTKAFSSYICDALFTPQLATSLSVSRDHHILEYFTHDFIITSYHKYLKNYDMKYEAIAPPPDNPTPDTQRRTLNNVAAWSLPNLTDFMVCGFDTEFSSFTLPTLPIFKHPHRLMELSQYTIADFTFLVPFWLISTNTDNLDLSSPQYADERYSGLWLPYIDRIYLVILITKTLFYFKEFIIAGIAVNEDVQLACVSLNQIASKYVISQIEHQLSQKIQSENTAYRIANVIPTNTEIDGGISPTFNMVIEDPLSTQKSIFFSNLIDDLYNKCTVISQLSHSHGHTVISYPVIKLNNNALKIQLSRYFKLNYANVTSVLDLNNLLTSWGTVLLSQYAAYTEVAEKKNAEQGECNSNAQNLISSLSVNVSRSVREKESNSHAPFVALKERLFPLYTVDQVKEAICPAKHKSFSLAKWVEMSWSSLTLFKDPVTRSNWTNFPLFPEQIAYASLDAYISLQLLSKNYQTCIIDKEIQTPLAARKLLLASLSPAMKLDKNTDMFYY